MRISEIAEALELDTVTAVAEDREVTGVYACDFLTVSGAAVEQGTSGSPYRLILMCLR